MLAGSRQLAELMGVCDGLISDYSSASVDFMLLHRPMAFVLTDFMAYQEKRGFVFEDPLAYMPGEKIYDYQGVENFVCEHVRGTGSLPEERRKSDACDAQSDRKLL
ncbi:MAG: CDP-glycerol glycerophosphotransferase family protein [Blautia sp.]